MKHKHDTWGWMLAVDFFFAGMGAAMLVIAGITDLFIGEITTSVLGNFLAPIFVAIGAGFLILELGRPFQAWRVFMNPKAILTFGAWNMLLAIAFGFVLASFGIKAFPWSEMVVLRKIVAVLSIIVGLVVATYPGVLLARHKSRPFWNGPGMMVIFLMSSLVTGAAAHIACGFFVPAPTEVVLAKLPYFVAALLFFQILIWIGYIMIKIDGTTEREAKAAERWLKGDISGSFKIGFLVCGNVLPLILLLFSNTTAQVIGAILVLFGGLLMRHLVVKAGEDRTWLPGELNYRSKLPTGDEEFLKAWKC
jgi:protein NrfD